MKTDELLEKFIINLKDFIGLIGVVIVVPIVGVALFYWVVDLLFELFR